MTIAYNKNTPDYYLVGGLDKEDISDRAYGHKTRIVHGDFIVISSDQKINSSSYNRTWKTVKKTFLLLGLVLLIPFSAAMATGYIHTLVNGDIA